MNEASNTNSQSTFIRSTINHDAYRLHVLPMRCPNCTNVPEPTFRFFFLAGFPAFQCQHCNVWLRARLWIIILTQTANILCCAASAWFFFAIVSGFIPFGPGAFFLLIIGVCLLIKIPISIVVWHTGRYRRLQNWGMDS